MSAQGFCTRCGAARVAGAQFCTSCGAPIAGGAAPARPASAPSKSISPPALAVGALLVALGSAAAIYSMQTPTDVPRAVPGSPSTRGGGAPPPGGGEEGLPSGHPSIELPKEVTDFLDGLAAEADKDPKNVEAAQKLLRARYRASVINGTYRGAAEQALAKLLALDPTNSEGLRIAANLAYDGGDYPEAEKRFHAFLEKNPDDASAITDLGSTQLFQERPDDAIATYRAAIAKDPKFMQAHFNLGIALQRKGDKDGAIASLKTAMGLATTPDEKQHIENATAELEGREPAAIAGASPPAGPIGAGAPPAGGGGGMAQGAAGMPPGGAPPGGGMQGGMPMPPPAPERDVPSNASTDFQREAQKVLVTHPIVGPRVASFDWTGPAAMRVKIADFPMDQMPPFARAKFKSGMTEKIAAAAKQAAVTGPVTVEIVDDASGRVMETLDTGAAQ